MPAPGNGAPGAHGADPPRSPCQRRDDVLHMLSTERHLWIASAADGRPHLIPLAFAWDGGTIIFLTREASRTVQNLRKSGQARAALGSSRDVVIIEGPVTFSEPADASGGLRAVFAALPLDPDRVPGAVGVHLTPQRILAWRGLGEIGGRTIMAGGEWLG
jgi:hypothetical protein